MKIKSWVGQMVRIKREYLEYAPHWRDIELVSVSGEAPFSSFFEECDVDFTDKNNPEIWIGRVQVDFYGVELMPSRNDRDIIKYEPSHQIVIENFPSSWIFSWDAKYFEVVKEVVINKTEYQVDEEFNQ